MPLLILSPALGGAGSRSADSNLWREADVSLGSGWVDDGGGSYTKTPGVQAALLNGNKSLLTATYSVTYTASITAGTITPQAAGGGAGVHSGASETTSGDKSTTIDAQLGNTEFRFLANTTFDGTISNIVIKEA